MVHRRVIADSDDEDGDNPPSPAGEDIMDPPEVEPLSPHRKESSSGTSGAHNQPSDSTDQSFFASVYDEQQGRAAAQQSELIEQIIRQSQKASGSSGEISLPAKGKGKKPSASSATSVTSPAVLSRPGNQPSLFSDSASYITTPRKSAPGAWDVPSSPEGAKSAKSVKSSRGKNEKSYGKRRRGSKVVSSPAAAEIFMGEDGASKEVVHNVGTHNEMPALNLVEPSPQPAAKKTKVSLHDSVAQEAATVANFYVAQSNLTTMQKLEYQKVNAPQNSYPGLPDPLNTQKSSGATTIAYPTPSRYASSSGPPLPWERSPAADFQPGNSTVIDITSSPDVIAAGHGYAEEATGDMTHMETSVVLDEVGASNGDSIPKGPRKKEKKRSKDAADEDELVQDEPWGSDIRQDHKRRRSEQNTNLPNAHEGDEDIELITNPHDEPFRDEIHGSDEFILDIPATEPPPPTYVPGPSIPEVQPTPQPKKRGRKKKQHVSEDTALQEQTSTVQTVETQPEPDKPKKKRGRPRKSDTEKLDAVAVPEPEAISTPKPYEDDTQRDELASEKPPIDKGKSKMKKTKKKQAPAQQEIDETMNGQAIDEDRDVSPLKEISRNSRTSSQKSTPTDEVPEKAGSDQNLPPNQPVAKAASTPKPTPTATPSQPKVPYRVGLSKRTRITSLLKSIKR
ncbi:hypothetical protein F4818DRAFT_398323 [Hypoxylon cercidicola]|nr:hypothetical protein F4818DRAFT_398323 [Hypoxylon cercidicola]